MGMHFSVVAADYDNGVAEHIVKKVITRPGYFSYGSGKQPKLLKYFLFFLVQNSSVCIKRLFEAPTMFLRFH
jgi:hypothetical protein